MDERALQLEVERSRAARLRAWAVLVELRAILTAAGQELAKPAEKSFEKEGEILERALRKALKDRDEALRELATAARWVDRSGVRKRRGLCPGAPSATEGLRESQRLCLVDLAANRLIRPGLARCFFRGCWILAKEIR
jgi:hypothetical protein